MRLKNAKKLTFPLTKIGRPILREKLKKFSPQKIENKLISRFVLGMINTMRHADGVGLAANQINSPLRVFVMECKKNKRYPQSPSVPLQVYFNPRIIKKSAKRMVDWEGCLSIPHYRGRVPRSSEVTLEALDQNGKKVVKKFKGFAARIVQHEVDHLDGRFYIDHVNFKRDWIHLDEF